MELSLAGRSLLVTGSTQGVGAAIALEAAAKGAAAVAIAGRSEDKGRAMQAELEALGANARYFHCDLSEPEAPGRLFDEALAWAGSVDCLVNAAGVTTRASVVDATLDQWEALMALNLRAPFFLLQAFIRHRIEVGQPGSVVNVQSMNGYCGIPELAVYSATKGALATITRNAANAHLADRIRVNGINMGWSPTDGEHEMQAHTLGRGDGWMEEAARAQPLGRLLEPREVAQLAVYLLSDYSGLQTGTCVDLEQVIVGAWNAG
jgi:NAD(P)-dependent dehydrogenase (short-subunit alcohol dehydrogenase family)